NSSRLEPSQSSGTITAQRYQAKPSRPEDEPSAGRTRGGCFQVSGIGTGRQPSGTSSSTTDPPRAGTIAERRAMPTMPVNHPDRLPIAGPSPFAPRELDDDRDGERPRPVAAQGSSVGDGASTGKGAPGRE